MILNREIMPCGRKFLDSKICWKMGRVIVFMIADMDYGMGKRIPGVREILPPGKRKDQTVSCSREEKSTGGKPGICSKSIKHPVRYRPFLILCRQKISFSREKRGGNLRRILAIGLRNVMGMARRLKIGRATNCESSNIGIY